MATCQELQRMLSQMPGIESVEVVGNHSLIATVVSSAFRHQDEAVRQEEVWKYLGDLLGSAELKNIEFIFTSTPEEFAAASSPSLVA